jgi:glyoxylase-like metal-dependent hydrolase (beta-lactamase superfamily II)
MNIVRPVEDIVFFARKLPSANTILLMGERPILVDSGYIDGVDRTLSMLVEADAQPEDLQMVVNTHYHSDHVGGNHILQSRYDVDIAAHRWDAKLINRKDRHACAAAWLSQPVEQYEVDRELSDGDVLSTGSLEFEVLHTPGHTLGHISLYEPNRKLLICGDLFHDDDVGWMNPFREGTVSLELAHESMRRLKRREINWACSGHGPPMHNPARAIDEALERIEFWIERPKRAGWHAIKRIFSFALIIEGGLTDECVDPYLMAQPWYRDIAEHAFGADPDGFQSELLEEMLRSGAAKWKNGCLRATAPHHEPRMTFEKLGDGPFVRKVMPQKRAEAGLNDRNDKKDASVSQ